MILVTTVVTMHNNKISFIKILKTNLQLKNALIRFLHIRSIALLKMETKKMIKSGQKFDLVIFFNG